jgi:hypothetical protein
LVVQLDEELTFSDSLFQKKKNPEFPLCGDEFPLWAIILIVLVSVAAVMGVIVGVVVFLLKKKRSGYKPIK